MTEPFGQKQVNRVTGRYTVTSTKTNNINKTITINYYAQNGTQLKPQYFNAAEAKDLAAHNGYDKYYKTEVFQKDGNFYLKVTAKTKQTYGILAGDYLKKVNDGTIKQYNPGVFDGYHCTDDAGHPQSDLNKEMQKGDSVILPLDKVEIKDSPIGFFRRNIMDIVY